MTAPQPEFGGLEKFKQSPAIRGVLGTASLYAVSGTLGVDEFFRGAPDVIFGVARLLPKTKLR